MSNDLVPLNHFDIQPYDEKELADLTGGGEYLNRVQLVASTSELVGKGFSPGTFALTRGKDDCIDLGKDFRVIVCAFQGKACYVVKGQAPVFSLDIKSEQYQDFRAKSLAGVQGYLFGPEFLLWLDGKEDFATFHCSNKTSRQAATHLIDLLGKGARISSKYLKNNKGSWFGPEFTPDNTPFAVVPTAEQCKDASAKFTNSVVKGPKLQEAPVDERPR